MNPTGCASSGASRHHQEQRLCAALRVRSPSLPWSGLPLCRTPNTALGAWEGRELARSGESKRPPAPGSLAAQPAAWA